MTVEYEMPAITTTEKPPTGTASGQLVVSPNQQAKDALASASGISVDAQNFITRMKTNMLWRRFNNRLRLSIRASNLVETLRTSEDKVMHASSSLVDLLHLTCESGGPHIKLWLWGESPTATVVAAPVVAAPVVGADPLHGLSAETAAAPAGTGSSSPSTSSDPGRPQTTIAAITEYLAGLALGARRQTEEYGTFMGSPRLYNLVEGGKVARIQAMAKVLLALDEFVQGSGIAVTTSPDQIIGDVRLTDAQRHRYMELRRDQMVGLWRALALVLDYIYAERDMTIKRAAVKSRASHARLGANLFRATEAVQVPPVLLELRPVEMAIVKVANAIVSNIRHEAVHSNESPTEVFKVLARILAEEPSRPRVMTDRLKDLFSEDTSQQNEEYRAHVDTLIFSYYALLQQVEQSMLLLTFDRKELERLEAYVGHVEIVRDGVLEVVTFPTPLAVRLAVNNSHVKQAVRELKSSPEISRDYGANKLRDFVRLSGKVLSVIRMRDELRRISQRGRIRGQAGGGSWGFFSRIGSRAETIIAHNTDTWYWLALVIALAINLTIFAAGDVDFSSSYGCGLGDGCRNNTFFHWITQSWSPNVVSRVFGLVLPGKVALAVRILTILHFFFSSILFIGWLSVSGRVLLSELKKVGSTRRNVALEDSNFTTKIVVESKDLAQSFTGPLLYLQMLRDPDFLAHVGYMCISLASLTVSPMFSALELFALAFRVPIFNEVIHAVLTNPSRLLSTVLLGAICLWTFMLIGVAFFVSGYDFGDSEDWATKCRDFNSCFGYHVRLGMGNSPGISGHPNFGAVLFTFAYTFIILWLIVAVVSGTIIDNLGSLRDLRSRIADDLSEKCFICSIDRHVFQDIKENGFEEHVRNDHNVFDYLSFFIYLQDTDEFDYTPAEKFVSDRLRDRDDHGILPNMQLTLSQGDEEEGGATEPGQPSSGAQDPESRWWDFFPLRQAMVLQGSARARSKVASTLEDMAERLERMARRDDQRWRDLKAALDSIKAALPNAGQQGN